MEQQLQPAPVPLRGRRDHLILAQFCRSLLQPSFCIMLFAAACSAQQYVSTVFLAGVCMSFCLILTTTLRSLVVFCHGASFDTGASEAPLMPHFALKLSQSLWALLQSLLNRLGPKSKRSPGTACFAQLLFADHIDNNFFASRWTPEARVGVASPATSGASSEAKHRRYRSTCGLQMQCLSPRIMLSASLCSALMPVFLFSRMFLHTALMQIFSPIMSTRYRSPPAAVVLLQAQLRFAHAFVQELAADGRPFIFPLCALAGELCDLTGRQHQTASIANMPFTLAALACSPLCRCLIFILQRAWFVTCLCAPTFQILALKREGGSPASPACRLVSSTQLYASFVWCLWQLGVVLRIALNSLHLCCWCLAYLLSVSDGCMYWIACVSLLAAPASVRSSCGLSLGGCCFCVAARCFCAPLAQVPQPWDVPSIRYFCSAPWCLPLPLPPAMVVCMPLLFSTCCLRCLRLAFWPAQRDLPQPAWHMSTPWSPELLCVFFGGWCILRRALEVLLRVVLALCLKGQPRKPKPSLLARARVVVPWAMKTKMMTPLAASAQRLSRPPGPDLDQGTPRGPSRVPSKDVSPSPVRNNRLDPRPPCLPTPRAVATLHPLVLWSALTALYAGHRCSIRPPTFRATMCSRRLSSPQRRGLLFLTMFLSLCCVPIWPPAGLLPNRCRCGSCHVAHGSVPRCWSVQPSVAHVTFSCYAFAPTGRNRQRSRHRPARALQHMLCALLACVVPFSLIPSLVLHGAEGARASLGDDVAGCCSWFFITAGFLCVACLLLQLRWRSTCHGWDSKTAVQQGGGSRTSRLRLWFCLCLLLLMPVAGMDPASPCVDAVPPPPQVQHKRSFGRAVRRASAQAYTFYKGKRVSYQDLTGHTRPMASCRFWTTAASNCGRARQNLTTAPAGRRLRLFCWNCGGMGDGKYAEFNHWLDTRGQDVDVALVTETHWKLEADPCTWSLSNWHCIHFASTQRKTAGMLLYVSKRVVSDTNIRFSSHLSGRLAHVRLYTHTPVDLVLCYQHASNTKAEAETLRKRAHFWQKLASLLSSIPRRHLLLMLGDFNTPLDATCLDIHGPCVPEAKHSAPADVPDFTALLKAHQLLALNTHRKDSVGTYKPYLGDDSFTQIDFIFTRGCTADAAAKQAWTLKHFPLQAHLKGFYHLPIRASVPSVVHVHTKPKTNGREGGPSRQDILMACSQNPDLQAQFSQGVHTALSQNPKLAQLDALLCDVWGRSCTQPLPQQQVPVQADVAGPLERLWKARHSFKKAPDASLASLWKAWRGMALYRQLRAQIAATSKANKRAVIETKLAVAQEGVDRGNFTLLYQHIRTFAPKQVRTKLQIRDQQGLILGPKEEIKEIETFFTQLYATGQRLQLRLPQPAAAALGSDLLVSALKSLRPKKASLPTAAPAALWKMAAEPLAEYVVQRLHTQNTADWPDLWHIAWLCLLPKKPASHRPDQLRPISLLHPLAKSIAWGLNKLVLDAAMASLLEDPQFAYLPTRGVDSAMDTAFLHTAEVRALMSAQKPSVFARRAGQVRSPCCGGLLLSIDMSRAFDKVPWLTLYTSLLATGVEPQLAAYIIDLHSRVRFQVRIGEHECQVAGGQGLRQGCTLAPTLWLVYAKALLRSISCACGPDWVAACATAFSDDLLFRDTFVDLAGLRLALDRMVRIFRVLQDMGMTPNFAKSAFMVASHGWQAQQCLARIRVKNPDDGGWAIPVGAGSLVPIKTQHVYLGAVLSYRSQEKLTLHRRLQSAKTAFARLWTTIRNRKLHLRTRLHMWQVYIWSTLRYALLSSGLPAGGLEQLTGLVAKQIRLVTRQPAHIVHNTNQELFEQHQIMPPGEWLIAAQERRLEQAHVPTSCPANLRPGLCTWREQVLADLRQQQSLLDHKQQARLERHTRPQTSTGVSEQAGLVELPPTITGLACDVCGTYFPSYTSMMNHRRTKHRTAEPLPRQTHVNVYEHALDGMPQCKHCLATFSGWPQLTAHVKGLGCPVLRSLRVPQLLRSSTGAAELSLGQVPSDALAAPRSVTEVEEPSISQQAVDTVMPPVSGPPVTPLPPQSPPPQVEASRDDASLLPAEPATGGSTDVAPTTAALAPAHTSEPLPELLRSVRFFNEPDILRAASVGWEAVAQVPFAKEKLLNHCPLCFLWHVAGNGNCKKHMNAKHKEHKDAISRLRAECKAERTRFHGQVGLPCSLCNQIIDQPIRHAEGCSVLFGAKFLVHLYEQSGHGHGRPSGGLSDTAGGLLSTPAPECEPHLAVADRSEGERASGRSPEQASASRQGRQGPGQRQTAKGAKAPRQSGATSGVGSSRAPVRHASHPGPGSANAAQTGGRTPDATARQGILPVCGSGSRRRLHPESPLQDCQGVEGQAGPGPASGECPLEDDHVGGPADRDEKSPEASVGKRRGPGDGDQEPVGGSTRREPLLAVSKLGPCSGQSHHPPETRAHLDGQGGGKHRRGPHPVQKRGSVAPISRDETVERGAQVAAGCVSSASVPSRRGGRQLSRHPDDVVGVCSVASDECSASPGAPSAIAARETNRVVSPELVLRLQLSNTGNFCYMNALVHVLLWVAAHSTCAQVELFGGLLSVSKLLIQGRTCTFRLMQLLPWRMFLQGWQQPSRQHDIAEFASFLMRKAAPSFYAGAWQAWDPVAPYSQQDCGHTHCPVPLDPLAPECILQDAIAAWEHDHLVRGLSECSRCIMFHVRRFSVDVHGNVTKTFTPVAAPELTLQLPAGECPNTLRRVAYRVVGVIAHYGESPHSGHYRAFLVDSEGCWHATDDNVCSSVASSDDLGNLWRNSYLFFAIRDTELASLGLRASGSSRTAALASSA